MNTPSGFSKDPSLNKFLSARFENSFRSQEDSGETLSPPSGLTFAPDGRLVVSDDFNHRIQIYDADRNLIRCFGAKGKNAGEFHYPKGTAVDRDGNIYVADSWNHRIQKFDRDGNHLLSFGACGEELGQLNEPYDLHIAPSGDIIVVERYNHRVQFFRPDGTSLGWVGSRGTVLEEELAFIYQTPLNLFSSPVFEFPTSITEDRHGNFFISDSGNHRVVKFDPQWEETLAFGERGEKSGQFQYPLCVCAGPNDLLYVADLNNDRIQAFNTFGQFLFAFNESDPATPLKTPNLTAMDANGNLHVGLTFNTGILTYQVPGEPQDSLAGQLARHDSGSHAYSYFQAQVHEQGGDFQNAMESYRGGAETLWLDKDGASANSPDGVKYFLGLSRLALKAGNAADHEASIMKGIEFCEHRRQEARNGMMTAHQQWEEKALAFGHKSIEQQRAVLYQQEDPKVFNQELFESEKQDKNLFRAYRSAVFVYRKTIKQYSEYFLNVLRCGLSESARETCLRVLTERFREHTALMSRLMDEKEKHEEAMVVALSQETEEEKKWREFLIRYFTTRRAMDVTLHLEYELRALLKSFSSTAALFPGNPAIGKTLYDLFLTSPATHSIPKLLLGLQENWGIHETVDTLHKNLLDAWITGWGPLPPQSREIKADDFAPVPYDAEDLDLEAMVHALLVEGTPITRQASQPVCGKALYAVKESALDTKALTARLAESLAAQDSYEEKSRELFQQLAELSIQRNEWGQKLKQVNPQDKKQPIVINNNMALVDFQVLLVLRMIRTLDLNEANNVTRLVTGAACLACTEPGESATLFKSIDEFRNRLQTEIDQALQGGKTGFIQLSQLYGRQRDLGLGRSVKSIEESSQVASQITTIRQGMDQLEFRLSRWCKNANLVDKLFVFLRENDIWNREPRSHCLRPHLQVSFGVIGADMGTPLYPYGLAHTPEGELLVPGYENHKVYRFSPEGICLSRFGGWGNYGVAMKYPVCVKVDSRGFIYVLDEKNKRVIQLSPDEKFLRSFGNAGPQEQRLGTAFCMSIDAKDRVWVADPDHDRIQIYLPDGTLNASVVSKDLHQPVSVCCLEDGEYLVGDRSADLLKRFDAEGNLLHRFRKCEAVPDHLYFLAADPAHGIFASDFWNCQFIHLDAELRLAGVYKIPGKRAGEFGKVAGLSIHKDTLAVSDFGNFRVQLFKLPLPAG